MAKEWMDDEDLLRRAEEEVGGNRIDPMWFVLIFVALVALSIWG